MELGRPLALGVVVLLSTGRGPAFPCGGMKHKPPQSLVMPTFPGPVIRASSIGKGYLCVSRGWSRKANERSQEQRVAACRRRCAACLRQGL